MNLRHKAVLAVLLFVSLLFLAGFARYEGDCNCPSEDFTKHGAAQLLIDKELSTGEKMPTAGPLPFAHSMTVCMGFDQTNKGYPTTMVLVAEGSTDGRNWFPLTLAGTKIPAETQNGCLQVTPTRFVRVGWPRVAEVQSPGPRVTASVQVAY